MLHVVLYYFVSGEMYRYHREVADESRFHFLPNGDLIVDRLEANIDSGSTFQCLTTHQLSRYTKLSPTFNLFHSQLGIFSLFFSLSPIVCNQFLTFFVKVCVCYPFFRMKCLVSYENSTFLNVRSSKAFFVGLLYIFSNC